ncbi:MAG: hypothetical protein ABI609_04625 [Acidobacteriota bacterium]
MAGVALLLAGFFGGAPAEAEPRLVADLNTAPGQLLVGPGGRGLEHDGIEYFPAADAQHGGELWRSDGSAAGTYRLTDVCPGVCTSAVAPVFYANGLVYFTATDGERGSEIWRTDGTPGAEELFVDLCQGPCSTDALGFIEWKGTFWFVVNPTGAGPALWRTDGTAEGTQVVAELCSDLSICGLDANSQTFLGLPDPSDQGLLLTVYRSDLPAIFRTDGTATGTVLLHQMAPRSTPLFQAAPRAARTGNSDRLYFLDGDVLWVSDGTVAGTHAVRDIAPLVQQVYIQSSKVVDGVFYATFGYGEWLRSDGTEGGTQVLAQVAPASTPILASLGGFVYAVTTDGIWRTAGTPSTTTKVAPLHGYVLSVLEQPQRLFIVIYVDAPVLWTSDGTAAGTRPVTRGVDASPINTFNGGILFAGPSSALWKVGPAGVSAERLHEFQPADGPSGPRGQAVVGRHLLMYSQVGPGNTRLMSSDGTTHGTVEVSSAVREPIDSLDEPREHDFTVVGSRAFFSANRRFWATDGSRLGTRALQKRSGGLGSAVPIAAVGDGLLFSGHTGSAVHCDPGESEPWMTDGTRLGTRRIVDLNPFLTLANSPPCDDVTLSSEPGPGVGLGGLAFFAADDLIHGRELFATDGTTSGTRLVADINLGQVPNTVTDPDVSPHAPEVIGLGSSPSDFARLGSSVLFVADDGRTGRELWITNGRRRGTHRIADLALGPESSSPRSLVTMGGLVYFFARHDGTEALYRTDGTGGGTRLVSTLELDGALSLPETLVAVGDKVFFSAWNRSTGKELWTSQGTVESTRMVVNLRLGERGSSPQNLAAAGGVLVFAAEDGASGMEPWRSDGTADGTFRLGDIAAGSAASNPGPFSVVDGQVLFGVDDGIHGRELWSIPLAELADRLR